MGVAVPKDDHGFARCSVRRDVCYLAPQGPDRHDHVGNATPFCVHLSRGIVYVSLASIEVTT